MKRKHWYDVGSKIAQSERGDKSRGQWLLLAMLMIMAILGGSFFGYFLDTAVIQPPAQVVGICPPPALIQNNSCVLHVCTTNTGGQQTCTDQQAGYILGQNISTNCGPGGCFGGHNP